MAFCFKRKEAVPTGVRRLAVERIEAALEGLRKRRGPEAVHGVRKDIKKVRAVLRLARERMPGKAYRQQTKLLRKAAERLAPTRDAYVKGEALKTLKGHVNGQAGRDAIRQLRKQMKSDLAQAEKQFVRKNGVRKLKKLLNRVPGGLERLELEAKGWELIGPGLKTAYARGREAYLSARREPTVELLHDWRKRVKDLWYQVSLLRPMAHREIDAKAAELDKLSEYLGDDHDLVMLQQTIAGEPGGQRTLFDPDLFKGAIEQRRREFQSAALKLGEKVYAETPQQFCDRLAAYWEAWRKGKKRPSNK